MANISKIYDKAAEKEYMLADLGARNGTAIQNGAITPEKTSFGHILHKTSDNIYNPDLQTEETISPHYYVSGKPYETPITVLRPSRWRKIRRIGLDSCLR